MPSTTQLPRIRVMGPRRCFLNARTAEQDFRNDPPMWLADAEVLSQDDAPDVRAWRHLLVRRDSVIPGGHSQLRVHMPGLAVVRCRVQRVVVRFFDKNNATFAFSENIVSKQPEVTWLVQTLPEGWEYIEGHRVTNAPIMLCVGGELSLLQGANVLKAEACAEPWTSVFEKWGATNHNSLSVHSSGVAFTGKPEWAWSAPSASDGRFDVVFPRPALPRKPSTLEPLVVEINRQWLLSQRDTAAAALVELQGKFQELDALLRVKSSSLLEPPTWTQLALNQPNGPPRFFWRLAAPKDVPELRLARGELSLSLRDQALGVATATPRSIATINAEVRILRCVNQFDLLLNAARQLSVPCSQPLEIPDTWADVLTLSDGRLNWSIGRAITADDARRLRQDFPGVAARSVIESLISASAIEIPLTQRAIPDLPPSLAQRVELTAGTLRWFGLDVTAAELNQIASLRTQFPASATVFEQLVSLLSAQLVYELSYRFNIPEETLKWSSIETVYDPNQVAQSIRDANGYRRPDPDEVRSGTLKTPTDSVGVVEPPILWGSLPLHDGWAMLPFYNTTDEIYLRLLPPVLPEPEAALISGAAILGNDDPRHWNVHRDEHRWSVTILDADVVSGKWTFQNQSGVWQISSGSLTLLTPELVFNGFLWLSTKGPSPADALPDFDAWLTAVRPVSLRTPRTYESSPAPYVVLMREGQCQRKPTEALPTRQPHPVPAIARLGQWLGRFAENRRPVAKTPASAREVETEFNLVHGTSDHLSIAHRLVWFQGQIASAAALETLDGWVGDPSLGTAFRSAIQRLRGQLHEDEAPDRDIHEEMVGLKPNDDAVPWPPSPGWGDVNGRMTLRTILGRSGGPLNDADQALIDKWLNSPGAPEAFKRAVRSLESVTFSSVFEELTNHRYYKDSMTHLPRPLTWCRHPLLPTIQSLPLTQSQTPPSHPSSSRQLAPFELLFRVEPPAADSVRLPGDWTFGASPTGDNAAQRWPAYRGAAAEMQPAREWHGQLSAQPFDGHRFLPMAYLSLPGLTSHARSDSAPIADPRWLPMQLSFGLPYLDEVHALAELPREAGLSNASPGPVPDPLVAPQPVELQRETFEAAWRELAERGLLAAADAEACIAAGTDAAFPYSVFGLVEPDVWRLKAIDWARREFPGALQITDGGAEPPLTLEEPLADGTLTGSQFPPGRTTALRGWHGVWERDDQRQLKRVAFDKDKTKQCDVVGGSMTATLDTDVLRDQRGLLRGRTSEVTGKWLTTPVKLEARNDGSQVGDESALLTTCRDTVALSAGPFGEWALWFRDLPVIGSTASGQFDRNRTTSKASEGVNDADGIQRDWGYLQGYEWRLAEATPTNEWLKFGPLQFFPLMLENVQFKDDDLKTVAIVGRLQLPIARRSDDDRPAACVERESDSNAAKLTFELTDEERFGTRSLQLVKVDLFPPDELPISGAPSKLPSVLVWPLADQAGSPRLVFKDIELITVDLENSQKVKLLKLKDPQADLSVFGIGWSPLFQKAFPNISDQEPDHDKRYLLLSHDGAVRIHDKKLEPLETWNLEVAPASSAVQVSAASVSPNFSNNVHEVLVTMLACWGDANQPRVEIAKAMWFLPEDRSPRVKTTGHFHANNQRTDNSLLLAVTTDSDIHTPSVQLRWDGMSQVAQDATVPVLYVLPGFGVTKDSLEHTPGYASMSFQAVRAASLDKPPAFRDITGISEIVFRCDWGDSLQEQGTVNLPSERWTPAAFGSSAGSVSISWLATVVSDGGQDSAHSELLLNGFVEIKNLITWPLRSAAENLPDSATFTVVGSADWHHWRHTARVLLNQVSLDEEQLTRRQPPQDESIPTLFGFKPPAEGQHHVVQFLAVVEHQLAELQVNPPGAPDDLPSVVAITRDFRWTVSQEVRWAHPAELARFWKRFIPDNQPATLEKETGELARSVTFATKPISQVASGWLSLPLLQSIVPELEALGSEDATAVMDLSVALQIPRQLAAFRRSDRVEEGDFSSVQILPGEIDQAIPAEWTDFVPCGAASEECWSILVQPFLGRLQPFADDGLRFTGGKWKVSLAKLHSKLQIDPIVWLTASPASRPAFIPALTSRSATTSQQLTFAKFDLLDQQNWPWIDAVSLETGWFRLLTPPIETNDTAAERQTASVMAALPEEGIGRLSRHAALNQLFLPEVATYPPVANLPTTEEKFENFEWRYGGLLLLQAVTLPANSAHPYEFAAVGKRLGQVFQTWLDQPASDRPVRVPALTLLPPRMSVDELDMNTAPDDRRLTMLRQSVSFAPSPYLGMKRVSVPPPKATDEVVSVFADIVVAVTSQGTTRPVTIASQLWQSRLDANMPDKKEILRWATETRRGLAGDSLVAVVRQRWLYRVAGVAVPSMVYQFAILKPARPTLVAIRPRNLRAELGQLRYREGQFAGTTMPSSSVRSSTLLAPPRVEKVQPLHFETPPEFSDPSNTEPLRWDWGYSGLQLQVRTSFNAVGRVGEPWDFNIGDLWWNATSHPVQFTTHLPRGTTFLPLNFRSSAIRSLLPAPPGVPCPDTNAIKQAQTSDVPPSPNEPWQSVLPGEHTLFAIGGRPGAFAAFRSHLLNQSPPGDVTHITNSGSVPVQHRWPRPVHIPANRSVGVDLPLPQLVALAPWGSWFDLGEQVGVTGTLENASANEADISQTITLSLTQGQSIHLSGFITKPSRFILTWKDPVGNVIATNTTEGGQPIEFPPQTIANSGNHMVEVTALVPEKVGNDNGEVSFRVQVLLLNSTRTNHSLDARTNPHDTFFMLEGDQAAELRLELQSIQNAPAVLSNQWADPYAVMINYSARPTILTRDRWTLAGSNTEKPRLTLSSGTTSIAFQCADPKDSSWTFTPKASTGSQEPTDRDRLITLLGTAEHGQELVFELEVSTRPVKVRDPDAPDDPEKEITISGPPQVARFPVRFSRVDQLPLPLTPVYCQFEDPEYNQALSSPTARRSKAIRLNNAESKTVNVTLAADRQEYNSTSPIFLLFHAPDAVTDDQNLNIHWIGVTGVIAPINVSPIKLKKDTVICLRFGATENAATQSLYTFTQQLDVGDRIALELNTGGTLMANAVRLVLQIVAQSVTPPPEAGYALFSRAGAAGAPVECNRFAWSPAAGRIELVDPGDLLREVARRRAVFYWRTTQRASAATVRYAIQKLHPTGATIVPQVNESVSIQ